MTVRRSAGVEAVKGSVRSAWYAELNFISAFGVEVALADEAECIGVKGRKCENGFEFRIRRRGVSRGYSLPARSALRLRGTGKAAKSADFRLPGMPKIHCILVPVCYPALAHFTQKNVKKVSLKKLFALPECLPSETKKAVMRPPSRWSAVRGKRQTVPSAVPDEAEAVVERLTVSPSRCQSEWRMMKSFTSASLTPAARASRDTVIGSPLPNMYSEP